MLCGHKNYSFHKFFSENCRVLCKKLPSSWDIEKLVYGPEFIFHSEYSVDSDNGSTITHRKVIVLGRDDRLSFHANGKQILQTQCNNSDLATIKTVKDINTLKSIILQFDRLKLCEGIDKTLLKSYELSNVVQISPQNYRLTNCSLVINQSDNQCLLCREFCDRAKLNCYQDPEYSFFKYLNDNIEFITDFLPSSWEIKKLFVENEDVFAFFIEYGIDGIDGFMIYHRKLIILRSDDRVNYFTNGTEISETHFNSVQSVKDIGTLRQITLEFDRLKVCEGFDQSCVKPFERSKFVQISPRNFRLVDCLLIINPSDFQCTSCHEYKIRNECKKK